MKTLIILNQTVASTTIDIANAFVDSGVQVDLYAGSVHPTTAELHPDVNWIRCPSYSRKNNFTRALSWTLYTLTTFFKLLFRRFDAAQILAVTNPPLNLLSCLILRSLRRTSYHLLIFDVYPDALVNYGYAESHGWFVRLLGWLTRICMRSATSIFTISERLRGSVNRYCDNDPSPQVIHNWADATRIHPIPKLENKFLLEHHLQDKQIILYSGNFGKTHDLDTLLDAAHLLRDHSDLHFILIGDGEQLPNIERRIADEALSNVTRFPRQAPEMFPHSIACGDISIVTLEPAAAAVSVPSKVYYLLAAGSPILALADEESELSDLIRQHKCGLLVQPGEGRELAESISDLLERRDDRRLYAQNARTASANYTPKNALIFRDRIMDRERRETSGEKRE